MKKGLLIALSLLLSIGVIDTNAQGFFKKLKNAVESEVVKKVKKGVSKGIDKGVNAITKGTSSSSSSSSQDNVSDEERNENHLKILEEKGEIVRTKIVDSPKSEGQVTGKINGHEWVDLGLPSGTRWATCNVGATKPEQPGGLYAWGETATKTSYMPSNGKTYGKNMDDISGNATYDVATAKWGKGWRMPTKDEFDELLQYCNYAYVKKGNLYGHQFTNPSNNRSIFLPSTGHKERSSKIENANVCGNYWASTPYKDSYNNGAYNYHFGAALGEMGTGERSSGFGVRPVTTNNTMITVPSQGQTNGHKWVDLGLPSGVKWATCQIGAPSSEEYGTEYEWGALKPASERENGRTTLDKKEIESIKANSKYDVAKALWGSTWRLPSKAEVQELLDNCTWEWTQLGRIKGCKAISKINGNYIFFPMKNGEYISSFWTGDSAESRYNDSAYSLVITKEFVRIAYEERYEECLVHPVTK